MACAGADLPLQLSVDGTPVPYDEEGESFRVVHVGFVDSESSVEELSHANPDWSAWDGGICGGRPQWLDPQDLPSPEAVRCEECQSPMAFLLQAYCPVDEAGDAAFHRALYLFACRNGSCVDKRAGTLQGGAVRVLRCQLPRVNRYYAPRGGADRFPEGRKEAALCVVCGAKAVSKCGSCGARYCSKAHQLVDWRALGHKDCCGLAEADDVRAARLEDYAYASHTIEVDDEAEGRGDEDEDALEKLEERYGDVVNLNPSEEDKKFTQEDMKRILGKYAPEGAQVQDTDEATVHFMTTVQENVDQVLRYCRWPVYAEQGPIWVCKDGMADDVKIREGAAGRAGGGTDKASEPETAADAGARPGEEDAARGGGGGGGDGGDDDVFDDEGDDDDLVVDRRLHGVFTPPPCERCGAKRGFEMQVMPQLLHFLKVEDRNRKPQEALDFGTIAVYTCTASCGQGGGYVPEYAWVQPAMNK